MMLDFQFAVVTVRTVFDKHTNELGLNVTAEETL